MSLPRYPKYKDSGVEWLGEVPEHWTPIRVRFLLRPGVDGMKIGPFGSQLTTDMYDDSGAYKVYGQENVIARDFVLGRRRIDEGKFRELAVYRISPGDLLITMMGTSGKCDMVPPHVEAGVIDSHLLRLRLASPDQAAFVRLLIDEAAYVSFQVRAAGKGSIMHGLNSSIVKDLLLLMPPVPEQDAIVAFLDRETAKIDALVAEQERLIELLKEKRQAVISHAVIKGLNPDAPMKDSGVEWLGTIPAHWEAKKLKYVSPQLTVGIVVEPSKLYASEGVPALRSLNVRPGFISTEGMVFITESGHEQHVKSRLNAGDIVAVRSGQPGTAAVVPPELDGCNCIDLIVVRKPLFGSVDFLCWYFASDAARVQFAAGSGGAIQQHFNVSTAAELVVAVPPPSEQLEIAAFVQAETASLDDLMSRAQCAIDLLQERRSALISAAVTGQIDVREAAERAA